MTDDQCEHLLATLDSIAESLRIIREAVEAERRKQTEGLTW